MILSIRYDAVQYEVISWPEYVYPSGNSDLQPLTLWCKFNQYKAAFIYKKNHIIYVFLVPLCCNLNIEPF